ncbi:MAG: serine hydrolase domain-containing protein, partial [Caulobacteraceae bacterium]
NHTAGFVTDDPWADRCLGMEGAGFSDLLAGGGLFARPAGLAFEYSNLGYAVLGRAIARASGMPVQRFIKSRILDPLGMNETSFDILAIAPERRAVGYRRSGSEWVEEQLEPDGEFAAMGGLATTPADYARFVSFLLDAWPPRKGADAGPLRRSSVRELGMLCGPPLLPRIHEREGERIAIGAAYGLGMVAVQDSVLGSYLHHSGGLPGWGSNVLVSPETGVGLFAFANATYVAPFDANWRAAAAMKAADVWGKSVEPIDVRLERAAGAVLAAYRAGSISPVAALSAINLLADQAPEARERELCELIGKLGAVMSSRLEPRHALAGALSMDCERGSVRVEIALAPGPRGQIQAMEWDAPK